MAIYYVSQFGSDANNGLGPDASNATSKPFLTISKAIGASGAAAAGDTVYIAPGVYRATISVGVNGTSASWITVSGDPGNTQGFKDASGNLLSAGEVRVTNYTANDTTVPTSAQTLVLFTKAYLAFSNLWFIGGTTSAGSVFNVAFSSHDISFSSCMFMQGPTTNTGQSSFSITNTTTQLALNLSFDRCIFVPNVSSGVGITLAKTTSGSADYISGVSFQNSLFLGGSQQIKVVSTGTGTFLGGGITVKNCSLLFSGSGAITVGDAGISSTTQAVTVNNCLVFPGIGTALVANTSGQISENYNLIPSGRANVTAGANSFSDSSVCPLLDFGQWMLWGQSPRAFATPTVGSPLFGLGSLSVAPAYDWMGRSRPEGGRSLNPAVGYLERHDTAVQENVVVESGASSIRIDGPGSHEFQIPVDATATTISVKCQYDANHGTTTPPQAILVAAPELGVVSQTVIAPGTTGAWLTLTFAPITPTAQGVVRVQLAARPAAANGKAYFDTFTVA